MTQATARVLGAVFLLVGLVGLATTPWSMEPGLLLGLFALGVLTRRTGQLAALLGMSIGLGLLLFLQFGLPALTVSFAPVIPEARQ